MRLVTKDGGEVTIGMRLTDFRGDVVYLQSIEKPRHGGSTGRVYLSEEPNGPAHGYYPGVVDLVWVDRDDQGDDGGEGQDRESYSDDQDRESYSVD